MVSDTSQNRANFESLNLIFVKALIVFLVTAVIAVSGLVTMVGPQILITLPVVIFIGICFAFRRSSWALVFLCYPLIFGLISAWIGVSEMQSYGKSSAFYTSVGIGGIGFMGIAAGLWRIVKM